MRCRASILAFLLLLFASSAANAADEDEEVVLREAEKIERSLVSLVGKIRESTVAVIRYVESEENGTIVENQAGLGSGVVVSRDGKVFTNVHVVQGASRVEVVLSGGAVLDAEVFSEMPLYDFALLRVRSPAPPADFAKTAAVAPGQWAIAAGNPRGLATDGEPIVTLGIVSGKGRVAGGTFQYNNAIQTDAEINPGNSGGPLFDLNGRVIGINGLISTLNNAKQSVGVGYSIPGDQILSFLPSLMAGSQVAAGYSGLNVDDSTAADGGVMVKTVERGSPADKVGVRAGDRITGLNGHAIATHTDWKNVTAMLPNGRTVALRFERKGRSYLKKFTLRAPVPSAAR